MEIKDVDMFELENQRSEAIKKTGKYIELNIIIGAENDTSSDGSVGKYPVITTTMKGCGPKEVAGLYIALQGVEEQLEENYPIACMLSKLSMKIKHIDTLERDINDKDVNKKEG